MQYKKLYRGMPKKASPMDEIIANEIYMNTPIVHVGQNLGQLAGLVAEPASETLEADYDRNQGSSWAPGISGYRLGQRRKRQTENDAGRRPHFWSQTFGPTTSLLATTALGGLGGALIGGSIDGFNKDYNVLGGASIGAAAGAGASLLARAIGSLSAAVTDRRTKEEQKAYANTPAAAEWLIPGTANYGYWKTMGRMIGDSEERREKELKKGKA